MKKDRKHTINIRNIAMGAALAIVMVVNICGCASYKKISLQEAQLTSVKMEGASLQAALSLRIDNPSGSTFTIENFTGTVYNNGSKFAILSSADVLMVPKRQLSTLPLNVVARLVNPLDALMIGLNNEVDLKDFTVEFGADVKSNGITVPVKRTMTLDEIMKQVENRVK